MSMVGRARGQAAPTRSLNQKPHHSGQFRFSTPKVRPDPIGDSPEIKQGRDKLFLNHRLVALLTNPEDR